jgi:hypothetical protein
MTTSEWHVGPGVWERYVTGGLDFPAQSAVDTHVQGCAACQQAAVTYVDAPALDRAWMKVTLEIVRPRVSAPWTGLLRAGVPDSDVVVLRASSGLYLPWVSSILAALACAFLSGSLPAQQDRLFLLLAPLIPVLAVALAYDVTDPLRELETSTPLSKFRIALLRTSAALAVALPVTTGLGLTVPGLRGLAFVWLMPGLCLTMTMLLLLTWWTAWVTAGVVAASWAVAVGVLTDAGSAGAVASEGAQLAFAAITLAMAVLLMVRTRTVRLQGGY